MGDKDSNNTLIVAEPHVSGQVAASRRCYVKELSVFKTAINCGNYVFSDSALRDVTRTEATGEIVDASNVMASAPSAEDDGRETAIGAKKRKTSSVHRRITCKGHYPRRCSSLWLGIYHRK